MPPSNSVIRRYTPPTCTLEVLAQSSPLSRWMGKTVLKQLSFELRFDDPRLPEEMRIPIRGNRDQLETLCNAVTNYIQEFLQKSPESFWESFSGHRDSTRVSDQLELTDTRRSSVSTSSFKPFASQTTGSDIHLEPSSYLTHNLFLGPLANQTSGSAIQLSLLQLFDLATALDEYSADVMALPTFNNGESNFRMPTWAPVAAILVLSAGVIPFTPYGKQLWQNVQQTAKKPTSATQKIALEASPSPYPPIPEASASPGDSLLTQLPLGASTPQATPNSLIPQTPAGSGLPVIPQTSRGSTIPGVSPTSPGLTSPGVSPTSPGSTNLGISPTSPGSTNPGFSPTSPGSTFPSISRSSPGSSFSTSSLPSSPGVLSIPQGQTPVAPGKLRNGSRTPLTSPQIAFKPNSKPNAMPIPKGEIGLSPGRNLPPELPSTSRIPGGSPVIPPPALANIPSDRLTDPFNPNLSSSTSPVATSTSSTTSRTTGKIALGDRLREGKKSSSSDIAANSETLFDTPQIAEARDYLKKRWKPPAGLTQTLEYSLVVGVDGSVEQILPLGKAAREFFNNTGFPTPGVPFVSANKNGQNVRIRAVLSPDGKVQTFPESK
jgi:Domain of unknown function (DUF4335)